jgi:uncharacterized protein with HEPN domain
MNRDDAFLLDILRFSNSVAQMAGMRDRLIDAYHRTDWELVWKAVTEDLPKVAEFVRLQGIK